MAKPKLNKAQDWVKWARFFHQTYENFASNFGYETRKDTKEFDPESKNGKLMIATCSFVIREALIVQKKEIDKEFKKSLKPTWNESMTLTGEMLFHLFKTIK